MGIFKDSREANASCAARTADILPPLSCSAPVIKIWWAGSIFDGSPHPRLALRTERELAFHRSMKGSFTGKTLKRRDLGQRTKEAPPPPEVRFLCWWMTLCIFPLLFGQVAAYLAAGYAAVTGGIYVIARSSVAAIEARQREMNRLHHRQS